MYLVSFIQICCHRISENLVDKNALFRENNFKHNSQIIWKIKKIYKELLNLHWDIYNEVKDFTYT